MHDKMLIEPVDSCQSAQGPIELQWRRSARGRPNEAGCQLVFIVLSNDLLRSQLNISIEPVPEQQMELERHCEICIIQILIRQTMQDVRCLYLSRYLIIYISANQSSIARSQKSFYIINITSYMQLAQDFAIHASVAIQNDLYGNYFTIYLPSQTTISLTRTHTYTYFTQL